MPPGGLECFTVGPSSPERRHEEKPDLERMHGHRVGRQRRLPRHAGRPCVRSQPCPQQPRRRHLLPCLLVDALTYREAVPLHIRFRAHPCSNMDIHTQRDRTGQNDQKAQACIAEARGTPKNKHRPSRSPKRPLRCVQKIGRTRVHLVSCAESRRTWSGDANQRHPRFMANSRRRRTRQALMTSD